MARFDGARLKGAAKERGILYLELARARVRPRPYLRSGITRDLSRTALRLSDLDFTQIANEGMRLAARFAPRRSGKLRASIKANKAKSKAVIRAGGARVRYAAPINYGWKKRNIAPAGFMQKADKVLRRTVGPTLQRQINRIVRRQGF